MSDMKPLIEQSAITFQLNGSEPMVKTTSLLRYITPKLERIAPKAKRAIIFAGSKYFMRKVQSQRQAMKRLSAMR